MPQRTQRVALIAHNADPQSITALGARLCYAGSDVEKLLQNVKQNDQEAFVKKIMQMGHESVLEHVSFTFLAEGVSRVLLAQLTRHRIASFSVQSQRYVSYQNGFGYIIPPAISALGEEAVLEYTQQMQTMQNWYEDWQTRLGSAGESSNEDARFVLPNACETRVLMTMNARALRHFFALRMCNRAQWEIRELSKRMFDLVYPIAPALFADAGPGCLRGACPEGQKSCGKASQIRKDREDFISKNVSQTETNAYIAKEQE